MPKRRVGKKWSPAQRAKFMETVQDKRKQEVVQVALPPEALPAAIYQAPSLPLDLEVIKERKLSELIQAAEVLGLHVAIDFIPNGRPDPTA